MRKLWDKSDNHIFGEFFILIAGVLIYVGIERLLQAFSISIGWGWYIAVGFVFIVIGVNILRRNFK